MDASDPRRGSLSKFAHNIIRMQYALDKLLRDDTLFPATFHGSPDWEKQQHLKALHPLIPTSGAGASPLSHHAHTTHTSLTHAEIKPICRYVCLEEKELNTFVKLN